MPLNTRSTALLRGNPRRLDAVHQRIAQPAEQRGEHGRQHRRQQPSSQPASSATTVHCRRR